MQITAQSGPLSFKGSPYWMAPEVSVLLYERRFHFNRSYADTLYPAIGFQVIQNSNGSNLAVDIWSLGCTVLEMATTKPPWSQYEGVSEILSTQTNKRIKPYILMHLSSS